MVIGEHVKIVAVIHRREAAIDAVNHLVQLSIRRAQVFGINIHPLGGNAVRYHDHQIASIFGNPRPDELHLPELLAFVLFTEDKLVGIRRSADAVEIH